MWKNKYDSCQCIHINYQRASRQRDENKQNRSALLTQSVLFERWLCLLSGVPPNKCELNQYSVKTPGQLHKPLEMYLVLMGIDYQLLNFILD